MNLGHRRNQSFQQHLHLRYSHVTRRTANITKGDDLNAASPVVLRVLVINLARGAIRQVAWGARIFQILLL